MAKICASPSVDRFLFLLFLFSPAAARLYTVFTSDCVSSSPELKGLYLLHLKSNSRRAVTIVRCLLSHSPFTAPEEHHSGLLGNPSLGGTRHCMTFHPTGVYTTDKKTNQKTQTSAVLSTNSFWQRESSVHDVYYIAMSFLSCCT